MRWRLRSIPGVALRGVAIVVATVGVYVAVLVLTTPAVDHLRREMPAQTSFMRLRAEPDRLDAIALDRISPYVACAVVKAEDRGFFRHAGFEWGQIRAALWDNLRGRSRRGGSTITQQLARNLYLSPARSIHRKLREAFITRRLERSLDKRRILELYLNVVEWGDGVWGVNEAARVYFGRSPTDLGPFEAAFLASLLAAPRAPLAGKNLERAFGVQRRVLQQMLMSGLVDAGQYSEAMTRARVLLVRLSSGRPLAGALADAATANIGDDADATTDLRFATPIAPGHALDQECGLAQELAAVERVSRRRGRTP